MQPIRVLIACAATVGLAACGADDDKTSDRDVSSESAAASAPTTSGTYVPAPGDPSTHDLKVTIRDKGLSYDPKTCVAVAAESNFPDVLAFSGPSKTLDDRPIKDGEFPVPERGRSLANGTCEATFTVTLPYAPRYRAGVAREGHGIAGADDPGPTYITTERDMQDVLVLNYPH